MRWQTWNMGTVFKALALSAVAVCFFFFLGSLHASELGSDGDELSSQQVYIVYMGHQHEPSTELAGGFSAAKAAHHGLLNQVLDDGSDAMDRIIYSYTRSISGFAARLTKEEKQKLSTTDGVVSVFPSRTYQLQTTRSWDFLGFPETARRSLQTEAEVIVGMIDTGVWPNSPSFSDEGFGPPPSRWKGACHNFTCNNKIIGARAYRQGYTGLLPVDTAGHGTHTASTVAGRVVENVDLGGLAAGSARGAVPGARFAVYKVCWDDSCGSEDILAAFDDAVADGVDLISFSIGGKLPVPYFEDAAAIGAFHAMRRGVLTSASAGNSALDGGRVYNVAPWILSVAASSTDRRLVGKLVLGNGSTIVGASVNIFPELKEAPLVLPTNINGSCEPESLAGQSYTGKILLCASGSDGTGPLLAGAAGAVIVSGSPDIASLLPLPALTISKDQFTEIMAYVNKTRNPVGTIRSTETAFDSKAPTVASFSSRGPNLISPGILKPDLSAPGIDILAAWTPLSPVSGNLKDDRFAPYSIISGTSMACPHATGVAAYVKSFHTDWSPAMIMSALITTATPMDPSRNPGGGELVYGAGQLNPSRARDPGLVYDAREDDYVRMLCAEGYNSTQLRAVIGSNATTCPAAANGGKRGTAADLNYPTMAHHAKPGKNFTVRFPRTVTNVGAPRSLYTAKIAGLGPYVRVAVAPRRLAFSSLLQRLSFTVTVSGALPDANEFVSAAVVWSDGVRQVARVGGELDRWINSWGKDGLTQEDREDVCPELQLGPATHQLCQIAACLLAVSYASEHTAGAGVPIAASQSIHFAMTEAQVDIQL
ncbi:unnamed protein product [Miscanthus lutarioriparius]|uniref:Uncharacterized protein n=1 Tax=Miscanthus lutarioriparius TaxID=422564 RepID=A0A811NML1_9POAL|nr:unnamed protein product [Miscanthus lutarioriparius]